MSEVMIEADVVAEAAVLRKNQHMIRGTAFKKIKPVPNGKLIGAIMVQFDDDQTAEDIAAIVTAVKNISGVTNAVKGIHGVSPAADKVLEGNVLGIEIKGCFREYAPIVEEPE